MTEANKKTIKDLVKVLGGFGLLVLLIYIIPNGSFAQMILAVLMTGGLVAGILWFTPLGNPIKKIIKELLNKGKE